MSHGFRSVCPAIVFAAFAVAPAAAQNSTQAAPPSAAKEGGIQGDPRGAIRALGGSGDTDFEKTKGGVTIPDIGAGAAGPSRTGGTPAGTTGPGAR